MAAKKKSARKTTRKTASRSTSKRPTKKTAPKRPTRPKRPRGAGFGEAQPPTWMEARNPPFHENRTPGFNEHKRTGPKRGVKKRPSAKRTLATFKRTAAKKKAGKKR